MILSYLAFLHGHLDYMVARLFAAEEHERSTLINDIKRVRGVLNEVEEKELTFHNKKQNED